MTVGHGQRQGLHCDAALRRRPRSCRGCRLPR